MGYLLLDVVGLTAVQARAAALSTCFMLTKLDVTVNNQYWINWISSG